MKYKIVYDTSSDKYSSQRKYIIVSSNLLPQKLANLQVAGRIIFSVSQER
jgi:hypothetical protein